MTRTIRHAVALGLPGPKSDAVKVMDAAINEFDGIISGRQLFNELAARGFKIVREGDS